MNKVLALLLCFLLTTMSLHIEQAFAAGSYFNNNIKVISVTKGSDNTIKVKYQVTKNPSLYDGSPKYTVSSSWQVYKTRDNSKTMELKTKKKGTYTVKFKAKYELVGPQYIEMESNIAGRWSHKKTIKTFYKYPPKRTSTHTLSKKEALANHIVISSGIATIKFLGKRSPYKVALDLTSYGLGGTYTLKSVGVVGGYPTPVAGQYIRTTTSYNKKGMLLTMKMWTNKESYKKKVKPIYTYSQTYNWNGMPTGK